MTNQHPDYSDADLAILNSGSWSPEEEDQEKPAVPEAGAEQGESHQPDSQVQEEQINRVDLQPGGIPSAIEAILAVADKPVTVSEIAGALIVPEKTVETCLDQLQQEYRGYRQGQPVAEPRGFELRQVGGGWRLYARKDFAPWIKNLIGGANSSKLSRAVMETLAIIAYQQPTSRSYVASVRGTNVDAAFRTLQQHGLICPADRGTKASASSRLYLTTDTFLEKLGLNSLEELPALAPFLPEAEDLTLLEDSL